MTTQYGWVGPGQQNEYYSFTLASTTTVSITLAGLAYSAGIDLTDATGSSYSVTDANGAYVYSQSGGANQNASIVRTLNAGTYYIDVSGDNYYGEGTSYQLSVQTGTPSVGLLSNIVAGHVIGSPYNIGTLTSAVSIADAVSNAATNYYSFTLKNAEAVTISLSGVQGNDQVNLTLNSAQGNYLNNLYATATTKAAMVYDLAAGTYIISTADSSTGTGYNLAIAGSALPLSTGASSTTLAKSLGAPSLTPTTISDFVGGTDSTHYYTFSVASPTTVTVNLTGAQNSASLTIDSNYSATASATGNASVTESFSAGTHSIKVAYDGYNSSWTGTPFSLSLTTLSPTIGTQSHVLAGSSLTSAYSLGSLDSKAATVADWFGSTNTDNYYSFTLTTASSVEVQLAGINNSNAEAYIYILDGNNKQVSQTSSTATHNGDMIQELAAGTYYIHVNDDYASSGYSLSATATAEPSSGSTSIATAPALNLSAYSVADAVTAYQGGLLSAPVAIVDSTVNMVANLDSLQSITAAHEVSSITLTDSGTPNLSITATQLSADSGAINAIAGNFTLTVAAGSNAVTITGPTGHATTVDFSGNASQYTLTSANGSLTVSSGSVSDQLTNVAAIQFADFSEIVAATPGSANAVTTGNVTELYSAVLAREPDVGGLAFYQTYLQKNPNTPLLQFAEYFLNSSEYTANSAHNYAQSTVGDTQFVQDSYQNLLHRTPSASEVSFYVTNVMEKAEAGLTPGTQAFANAQFQAHAQMLVYFSASPEFLSDVQITASNPASAQHWLVLV
jgi:hypothetical protein